MPFYMVSSGSYNVRRPPAGWTYRAIDQLIANSDQISDLSDGRHMAERERTRATSPGTPGNAPITAADDRHEPPPIKGAPLSAADPDMPQMSRTSEPMIPSGMKVV